MMKINAVNVNKSILVKKLVSEMSSLLRKVLTVWSCLETVVL